MIRVCVRVKRCSESRATLIEDGGEVEGWRLKRGVLEVREAKLLGLACM